MYEIGLTHDAQKFYQTANISLTRKLNRCFDQLQRDPYRHPNIKRLKGPLAGYWRYRVGDWRVVYRVDEDSLPDICNTTFPKASTEQCLPKIERFRRALYFVRN